MRQYVGPPTVAAIAQMLKGGVQVNTNRFTFLLLTLRAAGAGFKGCDRGIGDGGGGGGGDE